MKLYGSIASPYVARVLIFAGLKGMEIELAEPPGDGLKSAESLAFNPIGKMPSLDVDGRCIPESSIICAYLEDLQPSPSAMPTDAFARAQSRTIDRIVDFYVNDAVTVLFRQLNPAQRDAEAVAKAGEDLTQAMGYLAHFMGEGPFCAGSEPSLGDCTLAPHMAMIRRLMLPLFSEIADPVPAFDRLVQWDEAVAGHSVIAPIVDEHNAALGNFFKKMSGG